MRNFKAFADAANVVDIPIQEPKVECLLNARRILRCFEIISGLKINFHKSCLDRVGKKRPTEDDWASIFKCILSSLPVTYLGLPLEGNSSRKIFWDSVVNKVELRLAPWKRAFISKDWKSICKSKRQGRLRIGRMRDKGVSLLSKWIWRFGRDDRSLWKNVICAKYGYGHNYLLWNFNLVMHGSPFVKEISRFLEEGHIAYDIVRKGFKVVVGNGIRVQLWEDLCWDDVPLKQAFPRIFALSKSKVGLLVDFRKWENDRWVWEVKLRRPLFDWEIEQWKCFMLMLETFTVRPNIDDAVALSFCPNGLFTVSSFRRCLEDNNSVFSPHAAFI
ncbi:hypothetical protein Ddye_011741 [Dipteronia dyeriana]|uniref:Uncharacterized protein n=1 Tax=Dipteronia dyeriana TaxID=168575 RepID=A0AAD9X314_9ROSI|nr:hypothetical protein Ddye_011741 [Dipteronia dyeriana]